MFRPQYNTSPVMEILDLKFILFVIFYTYLLLFIINIDERSLALKK